MLCNKNDNRGTKILVYYSHITIYFSIRSFSNVEVCALENWLKLTVSSVYIISLVLTLLFQVSLLNENKTNQIEHASTMKEKSNINNVKQLKIKIWKNQRRQTNKTL